MIKPSRATSGRHLYLAMLAKSSVPRNIHPEVFQYLLVLNMKRLETNEKNATVTMEELGKFPVTAFD
jgi:hypothetical protein